MKSNFVSLRRRCSDGQTAFRKPNISGCRSGRVSLMSGLSIIAGAKPACRPKSSSEADPRDTADQTFAGYSGTGPQKPSLP